MKRKRVVCPTCKQDMRCAPRDGKSGKDCPQCGQGMTVYRARKVAALAGEAEKRDLEDFRSENATLRGDNATLNERLQAAEKIGNKLCDANTLEDWTLWDEAVKEWDAWRANA